MSDRYAAWIRAQIADHLPEATTDRAAAVRLAHAWAALGGQGKEIFGMEMPAELAEREALRDECRAALRKWIPMLDKAEKDQLRHMLTAYALPLS
jgi:predicted TIM-barrel fold metal-dependent hydrolase